MCSACPPLWGKEGQEKLRKRARNSYQVLFDMRQDVTDLKKLVHEIMAQRATVWQIQRLPHLPIMRRHSGGGTFGTSGVPTIIHPSVKPVTQVDEDFQDTEDMLKNLSHLDEVEKEMIRKALEKASRQA